MWPKRPTKKQKPAAKLEEQTDMLSDVEGAQTPAEPESEPEAAPELESELESTLEPDQEPKSDPEPEPEPEPEWKPELEMEPKPDPEPQPEPEPELEPAPVERVRDDTPELQAPLAGERLVRAKELVQDGRIDEAISLYRDILASNPADLKARNNLGVLYDEMGQSVLAIEQFEAAERLEPENVEVLTNFGSARTAMAHYDRAEELLCRALRLAPENTAVRASIGKLHFHRGLYAQAELDLRWVCEQDDTHGPAFYYWGEALNCLDRFDEALEVMERATVLQPNNPKAFYTLGHLYDRKHLSEEAMAMYRRARELTGG
jgi:tetratricopeptide (TPR) repeat protein